MFGELNALLTGVVVFTVLAASIAIVVSLALGHRGPRTRALPHIPHLSLPDKKPDYALPSGADAALWSIVEAVPDPRNHLALTRDLSGEVRITAADRDAAAALFAERPTTRRIASPASTPVRAPAGVFITLEDTHASTDTAAHRQADDERATEAQDEDERLVRTSEFFFAGEPRLNRF